MNRKIIFMGTPEFATASLDALVHAGFNVAAVVTAPDRPAGRGRQLRESDVKRRALELGLPYFNRKNCATPHSSPSSMS
jgi:methionyl-tRNA formyltransferase